MSISIGYKFLERTKENGIDITKLMTSLENEFSQWCLYKRRQLYILSTLYANGSQL